MERKIFVLTGETSGDKLASKVISNLKKSSFKIKFQAYFGKNGNRD